MATLSISAAMWRAVRELCPLMSTSLFKARWRKTWITKNLTYNFVIKTKGRVRHLAKSSVKWKNNKQTQEPKAQKRLLISGQIPTLTRFSSPDRTAVWSGASWLSSRRVVSAPASKSISMIFTWRPNMALWIGVLPDLSRRFTSEKKALQ